MKCCAHALEAPMPELRRLWLAPHAHVRWAAPYPGSERKSTDSTCPRQRRSPDTTIGSEEPDQERSLREYADSQPLAGATGMRSGTRGRSPGSAQARGACERD